MYILGISAFYHDAAACLLKDELILSAAQEERFSRLKNDARFPTHAIAYCLREAEIRLSEVDYVVFYEKPFLKFERIIETYLSFVPRGLFSFVKSMPLWLREKLFQKNILIKNLEKIDPYWRYNGDNLLFAEHHQSHAASAFYPSPFCEALILTLDGVGEWSTATVGRGSDGQITFLKEIRFPHSLGLLYSAFTYYLGFKVNCDEYKVMGLAPYGKPDFADTIYKYLIDVKDDGSFRLNMDYFGFGNGLRMTNRRFHRLFGAEPRQKGTEVTSFHMDVACSIQKVTEEIMLLIVNNLHKIYGGENLCLAGGVALNCVANGKILRHGPFKNIWIQPAAGDAGGALGAAYAVYYEHLSQQRHVNLSGADQMQNAFLGPSYGETEIEVVLKANGLNFYRLDDELYFRKIAGKIAEGKVIGWFDGRMEFGPRALGARSILGDARNPAMQTNLNMKIKFRESFRPFAPVILEEFVSEYFDIPAPSPYMLLVGNLKDKYRLSLAAEHETAPGLDLLKQIRSTVPAITHVNYTSRIQTVNAANNGKFYQLLCAFHQLTGCPMIINTSFNRMDEPIVCTPEDAVSCFLQSGIDILAIENFIVEKELNKKQL
ncbi:MAG: carbamoyltransferase [Prolixibacteraceae bacterium]